MKTSLNHTAVPLAILAAAFIILFPAIFYPFVRDQALFAYGGKTIAAGGVPYRDVWDLKPPGIFLLFAALYGLSFSGVYEYMFTVHAVDVVCVAATAVAVYGLAKNFGDPLAAAGAAVWYLVLFYHWGFQSFSQTEQWCGLFLAAACALVSTSGGPSRCARFAFAGALCGLAAIFKFVLVPVCAPFVLYALHRDKRPVTGIAWFAAGLAMVMLVTVVWLWWQNGLAAYTEIQNGFMGSYVNLAKKPFEERWGKFLEVAGKLAQSLWLPLGLTVLALVPFSNRRMRLPMLALSAMAVAIVVVGTQNKFFRYHWSAVLPWLSVLAGVGLSVVLSLFHIAPRVKIVATIAAPVAWLLLEHGINEHRDAVKFASGRLSRHDWYARFVDGFDFNVCSATAAFIQQNSLPLQTVLVWGYDPLIYLLADRTAPTRFVSNGPLRSAACEPGWRDELMEDLEAKPPAVVLVSTTDAFESFGLSGTSVQTLREFPAFEGWLRQRYDQKPDIGYYQVFVTKR